MRVVLDNNLPRSLAYQLQRVGFDAVHVIELGLAHATDAIVRHHFAEESVIFLSRDDDFWRNAPHDWVVVWLALHNPPLAYLRGPVARTLTELLPRLRPGQRVLFAIDQVRVFSM